MDTSKKMRLLVLSLFVASNLLLALLCQPLPGMSSCLMPCCQEVALSSSGGDPNCCSITAMSDSPTIKSELQSSFPTIIVAFETAGVIPIFSFNNAIKVSAIPTTAPPLFLTKSSFLI